VQVENLKKVPMSHFLVPNQAGYVTDVAEEVTFKVMIDGELKKRLDDALAERKISLTAWTAGIVETFLEQDALVQSMLAQQIPPSPDLIALILKRLGRRGDVGSAGMRSAASPWGPRSGKPKS
jgi:hypothetical protein